MADESPAQSLIVAVGSGKWLATLSSSGPCVRLGTYQGNDCSTRVGMLLNGMKPEDPETWRLAL